METLDIYHGELVGAEVWSEAVCPQQELLPHQLGVDVLGGLDHALQHSTVQYSTVQYSTVQYSAVQYSTVQYSTVQYSTVQYSTVQYSTVQLT